jgi:hypothetical protein
MEMQFQGTPPAAANAEMASPLQSRLGLSRSELLQRYTGCLQILENLCGASATIPPPNTEPTAITAQDFANVRSALHCLGRPDIHRAMMMVLATSVQALSTQQDSEYSAIASIGAKDCFEASWQYLCEVDRRQTQIESAREEGRIPDAVAWLRGFGQRAEAVKNSIAEARASLRESNPALLRADDPRVIVLDDENDPSAILDLLPAEGLPLSAHAVRNRELRPLADTTGNYLNSRATMEQQLRAIYGPSEAIIDKAIVREYTALLPVYPGQGTVQFTVELERDEGPLVVVPLTGSGVHPQCTLFPANDSRIPNKNTAVRVDVGITVRDILGRATQSPFAAQIVEELSEARRDDLLHRIGFNESTSVVLVLLPEKRKETPLVDLFRSRGEQRFDSFMFGGERSTSLHTSMGVGDTGARFASGEQTELDRSRPPTIIVINTLAPSSMVPSRADHSA